MRLIGEKPPVTPESLVIVFMDPGLAGRGAFKLLDQVSPTGVQ